MTTPTTPDPKKINGHLKHTPTDSPCPKDAGCHGEAVPGLSVPPSHPSHPSHPHPPTTYPTSQPLSIIPRPPLPDEHPTPADTILEGIIFADEAEKNCAHNTVNSHLDQLNADQLPLTPHLQLSLRSIAYTQLIATRVANATRPQEDKKDPPAALYTAAVRANTAQTDALTTYLDLFQKHRQQTLQQRQQQQQQEEEDKDQRKRMSEAYTHDLRIPIHGIAVQKYPRRLEAIAKNLKYLDDYNYMCQRSGQPKAFTLPFIPTSLYPKFDPTQPPPTHPIIPDNPIHDIRPYTPLQAPCHDYPTPSPELFQTDPKTLAEQAKTLFPEENQ